MAAEVALFVDCITEWAQEKVSLENLMSLITASFSAKLSKFVFGIILEKFAVKWPFYLLSVQYNAIALDRVQNHLQRPSVRSTFLKLYIFLSSSPFFPLSFSLLSSFFRVVHPTFEAPYLHNGAR